MQRIGRTAVVVGGLLMCSAAAVTAQEARNTSIEERARGASRVVVASVAETSARYERNEFGDELIVTYARLTIEETVKGAAGAAVVAVEGGTVDGITMRVSGLPTLSSGERAVFFLTPGQKGEMRLHLRGQGVLKLDANDRVRGTSLTLEEVRRRAASTTR